MAKDIERRNAEIVKYSGKNEVEILEPEKKRGSFISFSYSYKSVSSIGGKTHVKSKEKRFVNGKFESEEFEGTMHGNVYANMAGEMQRRIMGQIASFLRPFGLIGKDKRHK